jgi:hypothetical protein
MEPKEASLLGLPVLLLLLAPALLAALLTRAALRPCSCCVSWPNRLSAAVWQV